MQEMKYMQDMVMYLKKINLKIILKQKVGIKKIRPLQEMILSLMNMKRQIEIYSRNMRIN